MPKIELIFFQGCPNIEQARRVIEDGGFLDFQEIDQGQLDPDHPYGKYSSPTILVDGKPIAGGQFGSAACSLTDWKSVAEVLRGIPEE